MPKQISFKSDFKFIIEKINKIDALISLLSSNTMFQFEIFWFRNSKKKQKGMQIKLKKPLLMLNLNLLLLRVLFHSSQDKISFLNYEKKNSLLREKCKFEWRNILKSKEKKLSFKQKKSIHNIQPDAHL